MARADGTRPVACRAACPRPASTSSATSRRRPAARADRRAHAARRPGGELLVPAPPGRLRVDRASASAGRASSTSPAARATARRCWRARRRASSASTPTPRPTSTRGCATRAPNLRFERDLVETLRRADATPSSSCRRSSTSRTRTRSLEHFKALIGRQRRARRVRLDAERADARPGGRREVRATRGTSRSTAPRSSARCARAHFATVELFGLFHARKLARARARAQASAGTDVHKRPAAHQAASTTASRRRSRRATSRCDGDRPLDARAGLRGRLPPVSGARRGRLAIVLHTHMPYVEGFGTWPFGEEWLWEAMATCYLPLLDCSTARGAPLTLSVTPVLADQLEAPGVHERLLSVPARRARHDATRSTSRAAARAASRRSPPSSSAPAATTRAPPTASTRSATAAWPRGLARHAAWTSSRDPRRPAAAGHRRRRAAAAARRDRGAPRTRAAARRGAAASGCPSARTRRGWTRCWRRPACTRPAST